MEKDFITTQELINYLQAEIRNNPSVANLKVLLPNTEYVNYERLIDYSYDERGLRFSSVPLNNITSTKQIVTETIIFNK